MAHARCVLDTKGYKHTLRICNTYGSSIAKMAVRTRFNAKLHVHRLSCIHLMYLRKKSKQCICDPGITYHAGNMFRYVKNMLLWIKVRNAACNELSNVFWHVLLRYVDCLIMTKLCRTFSNNNNNNTWNITHNTESTAVSSLSGGDHRWFKRSTGKKRPGTGDIHIIIIIVCCFGINWIE